MPDTAIVASFLALLQGFETHFTAPTFRSFVALACGWVLALGRHTVTTAVRAANATRWKHIRSFHRFFSKSRWDHDPLGLTLVRMIDALVPKHLPLVAAVDDTLGRHTGKTIAAASMHRDPLLSTAVRPMFHWGHLWVVLGITIRLFNKTWCLPVLFRLYRSEKECAKRKRPYRTLAELGAELIALLAAALTHRRILVVGDGAFSNHSVVQGRPSNVAFIGRSRFVDSGQDPRPSGEDRASPTDLFTTAVGLPSLRQIPPVARKGSEANPTKR